MAYKNTYYIVAANVNEYNDWLKSDRPNQIIPEKTNGEYYEIRYVSSVDILRGLRDVKGFYLPGCERHPEYHRIKSVIQIIKMTHNIPVNNAAMGKQITGVWMDEFEQEYEASFTNSTGGTVTQGVPTP